MGAQDARQHTARLTRFAAKLVCQQYRLVTQSAALGGGSGAKLPHAAGNLGGHIGKNLRSLPAQQLHRLGRERQLVFFYNSERFGAGGFVRVGGAGSDHIQWIAQNIAEYDREHLCGGAGFGESATLYA